MVSGDHHQVKYNDGRLDSLISDNIRLLRSIIGSELDDIYEEEFGSPFKVDATLTERASDDDGIVQEDASNMLAEGHPRDRQKHASAAHALESMPCPPGRLGPSHM